MKTFFIGLLLVLWMIMTFVLGLTIIGMFLFLVENDNDRSAWFEFKDQLIQKL